MFKNKKKTKEIVINCYRKLKSYIYYSNNLQFLKAKIAEFESNHSKMEESFSLVTDLLINETTDPWETMLHQIKFKVFPKISANETDEDPTIVSNYSSFNDISIKKVNFFIDAPIEVLIVDTLWTVLTGKIIIDKKIFGSEIQANILNKSIYIRDKEDFLSSIDFKNLSIYEPYFDGYKRWKNGAINDIEHHYDEGHDSTLISLDLTNYFYSVNVDFEQIREKLTDENDLRYCEFDNISNLIKQLYEHYSKMLCCYREDINDSQTIIPIGLVSAGIVSNLYLHPLDLKIKKTDNVTYYSRYVDDIVIVIKGADTNDTIEPIFDGYFSDCFKCNEGKISVIGYDSLIIQEKKIKVLKSFASQSKRHIALLKKEISNTSEPHLLPSADLDLENFINNAYSLPDESIKIRDIGDLNLNTLSLMRFIGSYLRSKKNTDSDYYYLRKGEEKLTYYNRIDQETIKQLSLFFKDNILFSLYAKWEKIFYFAILYHHDFKLAKDIYNDIKHNIEKIDFKYCFIRDNKQTDITHNLKLCLDEQLDICVSLALALRYDQDLFSESFENNTVLLSQAALLQKSNIFDNALVEFPMLNYYKNSNKGKNTFSGKHFNEYIQIPLQADLDKFSIKYAPRFIHFQEYCISQNILKVDLINNDGFLKKLLEDYNKLLKHFSSYSNNLALNITTTKEKIKNDYIINNIDAKSPKHFSNDFLSDTYIALANINLKKHHMFSHGILDFSQTTYERKSELYKLLNEAYEFTIRRQIINAKGKPSFNKGLETETNGLKFLAFPEISIPIQWIEEIAQFVRITGTAIVCGVKHFTKNERIFNCVATIIPIGNKFGAYHNSLVVLREKNDYSPEELSIIEKNGYKIIEKSNPYYSIFNWDNIRFSVFDCYELTDINARAIMKSKLDILFAIEYNKDINYFSNIVESASRDIYCFVAQINTSNYGDTKIVAPFKKEKKTIIDIKGGEQDSIHIGSVNIGECNDYQKFERKQEYKDWKESERKKEDEEKEDKNYKYKKYRRTSARHNK